MKLYFKINYVTKLGERLVLQVLMDNQTWKSYDLYCENTFIWQGEVDYFSKEICYKYQVLDKDNQLLQEEIIPHRLFLGHSFKEYQIIDTWNSKNFPENYLNNKIFRNTKHNFVPEKLNVRKKHTHLFRIEAPLYKPNWKILIFGEIPELGAWQYDKAVALNEVDFGIWEVAVELNVNHDFAYKYGIYDDETKKVIFIESGDNRITSANNNDEILQVNSDHYFVFDDARLWHAAGVAVPVFSLRSDDAFGVGEFLDLKLLADWSKDTDLSIIQILPINDTTANYTWTDSYPYAAISVYALHSQYLRVDALDFPIAKADLEAFNNLKSKLNQEKFVDYEVMMSEKWNVIKKVFNENASIIFKDKSFKSFLKENKDWLLPYAAFCVLRDKYKTPNFNNWKTHKRYVAGKIATMFDAKHKDYSAVMMHAWVQYQLHLQLTEAIDYAHSLGISLKGDLPIGIYRYSVEAWAEPELFGMDFQAGAPPDQFSDLGQNWEFPTYNWEVMKADGYNWWKKRFAVLERYFDAMRIDHILGFFRIWRMPIDATQGVLGYFYPAIPVTKEELHANHIDFNEDRFCKPFINDSIIHHTFGEEADVVKSHFFELNSNGLYKFKPEFDTQRKLSDSFKKQSWDWKEEKLLALAANVLFIIETTEDGENVYHPRFNMEKTLSFANLPEWERVKLAEIYNDYFFVRQDDLWYEKAMEKLPALLTSTKMLICGEDLGLVPDSVPVVMDQLAITALKVQRMPSENIPFYDPKNASYMNVVTASSHDSSTLRQWWHEDREMTQQYFNQQLKQYGTAPWDLLPDFSEMIMKQHLYTDAMLAIFPIQEFLATDQRLMNENMDDERINVPAIFPHYWRYRMHLKLEDLKTETAFNQKISDWVKDSGRK
ncbi:4-alpha-glucanotransferase [Soonwooa buanensis]|uniref:4-alpha-glucanotransferase n=1 Tax=Soonwooa buanensis TaxID=619805 RepID=A0A1T5DIN7_9FLAO|nr:4-alpha-glucanotransferase [Soonwooa buanensis]SKB71536.1 4-alpha-glucanotransferase [Soonwooa buanensis]